MSDSENQNGQTPSSFPPRERFPASPQAPDYQQQPHSPPPQNRQQTYSPIAGSQNIPPPAYSPLPSIDAVPAGPVLGPDGHIRERDDRSSEDSMDVYTTPEERDDAGPGSQPPPSYTETYGELDISQDGMGAHAKIAEDGRVNININQKTAHLSVLLAPAMRSQLKLAQEAVERGKIAELSGKPLPPDFGVPEFAKNVPPLNILIQIIGSRGDVQPFIALGQVLKNQYRHRVRVATHPTFKGFVEENGLEFFSIGGDPAELMAFMVKNPGLMPGLDSLKSGEVGKRRKGMWEMLLGGWRACIEPGDGMSYTPDYNSGGGLSNRPFIADAIIANPPSFGHIHCAEKLGIPLHLMFTMPWSPTTAFPHPLANIQSSNAESGVTNFLSYVLVEMMTWQGLGDLVNRFREQKLGLDPVSTMWAPGMISRLQVPHTYCWSAALIPKPLDWPRQISISGFYFLSLASSYTPPPDLQNFLESGPPPVYIGFGSIVVDDPNALTNLIFTAVRRVGVRALVSKGWGGLGGDQLELPPGVMMLGNCPHDWLFPRCAAVVHHGGAGTTAAGIKCGKPTVIVPFFGDQPFWGSMVAKAGAGPKPVPFKQLTAEILAESIGMALGPEAQERAHELGSKISHEKGAEAGAELFLGGLAREPGVGGIFRCMIDSNRIAVWRVRGTGIMLSAFAAGVLVSKGAIENDWTGLKLCRHKEWETDVGPYEPISGGAGAILGTMGSVMMGFGDFPKEIFRTARKVGENYSPQGAGSSSTSISSGVQGGEGHKSSTSINEKPTPGQTTAGGEASDSKQRASIPRVTSDDSFKSQGSGFKLEGALGVGKGVSRIVGASMRSPMEFTLGLAQGFHNAPKLYGDEVRPAEKVTGFQSGLKAAGKGLSLGLYDGITGLVTQPMKGAKEDGAAGFFKGVGRGIGGVVLKGGAAIWGVPGYTMKGIHREIQKLQASNVDQHIINSRIVESQAESHQCSDQEQKNIVERWYSLRYDSAKKQRKRDFFGSDISGLRIGAKDKGKNKDKKEARTPETEISPSTATASGPPQYTPGVLQQVASYDDEELERAIQGSVRATSNGNPSEDKAIEAAIRTSVSEMQYVARNHPMENIDEEEEAYQRAIRDSMAEASRIGGGGGGGGWVRNDQDFEEALQKSLTEHEVPGRHDDDFEWALEESKRLNGAPNNDEELERALRESRIQQKMPESGFGPYEEHDEELLKAIAESKRLDEEKEARRRTEEEVVMEYVMKASLEEQEYQRRRDGGSSWTPRH